jgi:hypothetical protein
MTKTLAVLIMSAFMFGVKSDLYFATCYGNTPCNACRDCKYCGHCAKQGGTCGVCRRLKSLHA